MSVFVSIGKRSNAHERVKKKVTVSKLCVLLFFHCFTFTNVHCRLHSCVFTSRFNRSVQKLPYLLLHPLMAKFNPFPAPKKGKARMVQKRPASTKSKAWSQVPYTRDESAVQPRGLRMDQSKWKRSLLDLVRADDKGIVEKLVADKILVSWEGKQCPKCEHGTLSKLKPGPRNGSLKHKCNYWRCKAWLNPHYLHPLFTECKGPEGHPLQIPECFALSPPQQGFQWSHSQCLACQPQSH